MTHYERLGLRPPSDPKEIKLAYLKRAKACHPGTLAIE
jgi:curved DNA-binding protein CbpA